MGSEKDLHHVEKTRRELLARMGTGLVAVTVNSAWGQITPPRARSRGVALRHFTARERRTLETLGDVLLPGARTAGIAHYIDDQLSRDNPLLMLKYLDYLGSYTEFYKSGLRSLDQLSRGRHQKRFHSIPSAEQIGLVREISSSNPAGWSGPPAPLFYFVTRNDAVDVFYGTPEGFEKLSIPYMEHILPPQKW